MLEGASGGGWPLERPNFHNNVSSECSEVNMSDCEECSFALEPFDPNREYFCMLLCYDVDERFGCRHYTGDKEVDLSEEM